MPGDVMRTAPLAHQEEGCAAMRGRPFFALFCEQGLGKTWMLLRDAAEARARGEIDALLVVAPNGVHRTWVEDQIPQHLGEGARARAYLYVAGRERTKRAAAAWSDLLVHPGLAVLAVNVEAISSGERVEGCAAYAACDEFLRRRRAMMVVDESSRIKSPASNRTRRVTTLGRLAPYRRIATGTPVTQSPLDLYAQFRFLERDALGFSSYYGFRRQYAVVKREVGRRGGKVVTYEVVVSYVRLDDLRRRIEPYSFRRTKEECLDLPEKIYQRVSLEMSPEQRRLYDRMDEEGILDFDDFDLVAPNQLIRLLRLQQITGGFVPREDGGEAAEAIPGANPKLAYVASALEEDYPGKAIVWARFRAEIAAVARELRARLGAGAVVELHGGVTGEDRAEAVRRFQEDPSCRVLVGQQQSGIGITLHAAETVFYYSNPFSYEQRYQSEDRAHRIGLRHPVVYVDLAVAGTVDEKVRDVLLRAKRRADAVTGDAERRKFLEG